jgi:hypothetical protein
MDFVTGLSFFDPSIRQLPPRNPMRAENWHLPEILPFMAFI